MSSMSSPSFINNLPTDTTIHDIRYRFKGNDIWAIIATTYAKLKPNARSKDISLNPIETNNLTVRVVIHHTDMISVIVGCSLRPVILDIGS
jgi:hypothetical protein